MVCTNMSFANKNKQKGFTVAQLAIAVTLFSIFASWWSLQNYRDTRDRNYDSKQDIVGDRLQKISSALHNYTATHNSHLLTKDEPIGSIPSSRILAPSIEDLVNEDFLEIKDSSAITYGSHEVSFEALIQRPVAGSCTPPDCRVVYSVKTTNFLPTPESVADGKGLVPDIQRAISAGRVASPASSGVSYPDSMGNPSLFMGAEGNVLGTNPSGIPGLIYVVNAYDTKIFEQFLRRNGTNTMTGNLRMQDADGTKHDIVGAGTVEIGEVLDLSKAFVAVDGTACGPEIGAVTRDANGLLLSCQSGGNPPELKWRSL